MVDQWGPRGVQLLMVIGQTAQFGQKPDAAYCQGLQDTQKASVFYDPNGYMTDVLKIKVNMGAALLDENGIWLSPPEGDESYAAAVSALFSLMMGPGF